jgi:hypothetical protein
VLHVICVEVHAADVPCWVTANDLGTLHRLRIVHRADGAAGGAQEAFRHAGTNEARANKGLHITRDRTGWIDGGRTAEGSKLRGGKPLKAPLLARRKAEVTTVQSAALSPTKLRP